MTGLYPVKSGAYPNHTFIDEGVKTLPYYLKKAGYRVAMQVNGILLLWRHSLLSI